MHGVALTPLTVDFHEGGFRSKLNSESKAPFWFQMDSDARQQHGSPMGPANPQALNRYAYVQNNPLKYTDPSGHYLKLEYYGAEAIYLLFDNLRSAMHNLRFDKDSTSRMDAFNQSVAAIVREIFGPIGTVVDQLSANLLHILSDDELWQQFESALSIIMDRILYFLATSDPGDGKWLELWMDSAQDLGGGSYTHYFHSRITDANGKVTTFAPIYMYKSVWWEESQAGHVLYTLVGGPKPKPSGNQ
jgi:hypothetical protein